MSSTDDDDVDSSEDIEDTWDTEVPMKKSCDTCEREFFSIAQYHKHMSEHRVCGIEGCSFTAHEKIIEKHVWMQHRTGLYDKIRSVSTPEDVAKWIEERKRKYPTKENIENRYKQQAEMFKRGERIQQKKTRFAKRNEKRCKYKN